MVSSMIIAHTQPYTLAAHVYLQVNLVCDMSVLQLYLLAGMVRLSEKKHTMYNFEVRCLQLTVSSAPVNSLSSPAPPAVCAVIVL